MGIFNFPTHVKGDTFSGLTLTLSANGLALPLSSAQIEMKVRRDHKRGREVDYLSLENGRLEVSALNTVALLPFIMDYPAGIYFYDMRFKFDEDNVKTYIGGNIIVEQDVTYE